MNAEMKNRPLSVLTIAAALLGPAAISACASDAVDVEYLLNSADCADVLKNRAFDIRVFGRSFPVTRGFNFHGFEFGADVYFHKMPDESLSDFISSHPNQDLPISSKVEQWNAMLATVSLSSTRSIDTSEGEPPNGYDSLNWKGLRLLIRENDGGRAAERKSYQVLVQDDQFAGELAITALDLRIAANLVACAR